MGKPIVVTDDTFQAEVLNADKPVLVDFWAEWCGPCRMIAPHLEALADEQEAVLTIAKFDVDENPAVPGMYNIHSIPTLLLFKDGEAVARITGALPKKAILSKIEGHLAQPA